ncbi:unnamed protein product [Acanthosepion pharaonis]|uniref:Uncharacterized protein n=1 Tax=Acanthosepion pharaonis TaxID=158019 RepID=A0A812CS64_ACAPH|nr:unnamed protein product [Sepia pharaonis]
MSRTSTCCRGSPILGSRGHGRQTGKDLTFHQGPDTALPQHQQECNNRQLVHLCAPHPGYAAKLWDDAEWDSQVKQVRDTRRDKGQDHTGSSFQCLLVHEGHDTGVVCAQNSFQQENCPPRVFNAVESQLHRGLQQDERRSGHFKPNVWSIFVRQED